MKRMYEKLMAYEEAFVANEYVAACYGLACSVGFGNSGDKGNKWKYDEKGSVFHEDDFVSGTCTDASANRVITNDGSVVKSVGEYNKDQGWLDGGFDYWGQSFVDRRWNHYGILAPLDSSCPSHS